MSQPVLALVPGDAVAIGPSAGLVEGPDGGVVFVFGLATFAFAKDDQAARRLAAVQLVATKIASAGEVASAFAISQATLWRWVGSFSSGGVAGLIRSQPGPKRPSKLTDAVAARIVELGATGMTLLEIGAQVGVSTATVRVALGRVSPRRPASDDEADAHEGDTHEANPVEADVADPDGAGLTVLAPPLARSEERRAARFGELDEAPVVITEGAHLPLVGLLLGLPALEMTGLLDVAAEVFGPMAPGFYGLRATLLTGVFMALAREPRAEGVTRLSPPDLGRLLGLDRAPEVKTLRRKLAELAGAGLGAQLQAGLGRHHAVSRPDAIGFLYIDGHVRVYTGTRQLPKTHIARMRIAGPATEETWVADAEGDPVMVLTAAPSQSLAAEVSRLLPRLRELVGPDRRVTVTFDRGGYSPAVFAEIVAAGFDVLTYFKGTWARSDIDAFTTTTHTAPDATIHTYELAERPIELDVPAKRRSGAGNDPTAPAAEATPAGTIVLRLILRRSPDGHQTPVLTSRADLSAAEIAYRMANRWRQENYFKYAREHFALDALDSYADHPDDPDRLVPNPAKARAVDAVIAARKGLADANAGLADALDDAAALAGRPANGGRATVAPAAGRNLARAKADLTGAKAASATTPSHLPLSAVRPGSRLLETERKLLTHAIRMSAYNAESALARLLRPHYARGDDEGRALLREAFTLSGDLQVLRNTLHVRLDPASAPRRSKALAALCAELTAAETRYPGTELTIAYSVKAHPTDA